MLLLLDVDKLQEITNNYLHEINFLYRTSILGIIVKLITILTDGWQTIAEQ